MQQQLIPHSSRLKIQKRKNVMDTDDDESTVTSFLPIGIPEDLRMKKSRCKTSFGPIGGRNAAGTMNQAKDTSEKTGLMVLPASTNSKCDVDFNQRPTRPCATAETSLFGPSCGLLLSRETTNLLLSESGGDINTSRASKDFQDAGRNTLSSNNAFELSRHFGSAITDGEAMKDARTMRASTSILDIRQKLATGFPMQEISRTNVVPTRSFGVKTQQLYGKKEMTSYWGVEVRNSLVESCSIGKWPSLATEVSQPRQGLHRPPGLIGPPGFSEATDMQSCINSKGESKIQQQASNTVFLPFDHSSVSPLASKEASHRYGSGSNHQYRPTSLSYLRSSTGVFGDSSLRDPFCSRAVSNLDLAELNTHSIKVGDIDAMGDRQAVDTSYNRESMASRRIDIQASSKAPRSTTNVRNETNKPEKDRGKALEFDIDATNVSPPESSIRPKLFDCGRHMASRMNVHGGCSSNESKGTSNDISVSRDNRCNQIGVKSADLASFDSGGNDNRWRKMTNQSKEPGSILHRRGLNDCDSHMKFASQKSEILMRRENAKFFGQTPFRKSFTRGNDSTTGIARRQVYREKQEDKSVQNMFLMKEAISPSTSLSSQKIERSNDSLMPEVTRRKEITLQDDQAGTFEKSEAVCEVPSSFKARISDDKEVANKFVNKHREKRDISASTLDQVAIKSTDEIRSMHTSCGARHTDPTTSCDRSTKPEPCSVGDVSEGKLMTTREHAEQARVSFDQQLMKEKKSKKENQNESSPPVTNTAAALYFCPQNAAVEKKHSTKEYRKEKSRREKVDKKKLARGRKDKRGMSMMSNAADAVNNSAMETQDKQIEASATETTAPFARIIQGLRNMSSAATTASLLVCSQTRYGCVWVALWLSIKDLLATTFSYVESVFAVAFSVVLLFSLHAASWLIRINRTALHAISIHRHIAFCFAFLYGFPFLVQYVFPWAPPWAPVCLWYAFLFQLFCTNGSTAMVTTFRVLLPLVFLVEGISHHSFLLDLNGAELLLTSFIISALKTSNLCSPICFLSLATQCLLAVFLGSKLVVQWLQLALALYSLHAMAVTDDKWTGIIKEDEDRSCHPVSTHYSFVDCNHHITPPSTKSIQKTKTLDRRALAYVRGCKLR